MIRSAIPWIKRNPRLELLARRAASLVPFRLRQRAAFHRYATELAATERLTVEKLRELQLRKLLAMITYAYDRSPFYRRLYDEHGVNPSSLQTFDDVSAHVPIVTREMLRDAHDVATPQTHAAEAMTSGTTGSAFVFAIDRDALAMETAAIFHQWGRVGFTAGTPRIEMRGFQTRPIAQYPDAAVVRFSVVNMQKHVDLMADFIDRSGIEFLHGYPSALAKFAFLMRERGRTLRQPIRAVLLASENVLPWQVDVIREVIQPAAVMAHYGTAERTVLGAWCEHSTDYHFMPLYGYLEQGASGEIIGTGFLNHATPFVRYRTSDVALDRSDAPCAQCGRAYVPRIGRIGGRLEDYLVATSGELIPPAVITMPFKRLAAIRMVQIQQAAGGAITLNCVLTPGAAAGVPAEQALLTGALRGMLGDAIPISFKEVDEIPLTPAGKFKWIISDIAAARQAQS